MLFKSPFLMIKQRRFGSERAQHEALGEPESAGPQKFCRGFFVCHEGAERIQGRALKAAKGFQNRWLAESGRRAQGGRACSRGGGEAVLGPGEDAPCRGRVNGGA